MNIVDNARELVENEHITKAADNIDLRTSDAEMDRVMEIEFDTCATLGVDPEDEDAIEAVSLAIFAVQVQKQVERLRQADPELAKWATAIPPEPTCPWTDADECNLVRERMVAGWSVEIPACPVHGKATTI